MRWVQLKLLISGLVAVAAVSAAGMSIAGKDCYFRRPMLHPNITGWVPLLRIAM